MKTQERKRVIPYFLLMGVFLFLSFTLKATDAPITTAGTVCNAVANQQVTVPITVTGFTNISGLTLTMDYDYSKLHFVRASSTSNPALGGTCDIGEINMGGTNRRVTISWYRNGTPGITLPDGTAIANYAFTYISGPATLTWFDMGPSCVYNDPNVITLNDTPTSTYYINGSVSASCSTIPTITTDGPTSFCASSSVNLIASAGIAYKWSTGATTQSINVTTSGSYTVEVTDAGGAKATSEATVVTVTPSLPVSVSLIASANPVCAGTEVTYTPTPVNGGSNDYNWYINGVSSSSTTGGGSWSYIPKNSDIVQVELVSNLPCATGSPIKSNAITMVVNPVVSTSVSIASDANNICSGTQVTMTPTPVNGGIPYYRWYRNNDFFANTQTLSFTPENGDEVYLEMTSSLACPSSNPATSNKIKITVNPVVTPSVSIAVTSGANPTCSGSSVTFTATPVNGGATPSYQWKKGVIDVGSNSATYIDNGTTAGSITVVMISTLSCVTSPTATSNAIDLTVTSTGQWLGLTSDWNTPSNWCGGVPNSFTNVSIPTEVLFQPVIGASTSASCNNINIAGGATLTLKSDASGTGSLIVSGSVSGAGSVIAQRYMKTGKWNYVSSPVSGQSISEFLTLNTNVAQDINDNTIRGMMDYNPASNVWNDYFTNSTVGTLGGGKGFCMRTTTDGIVSFTGNLQKGIITTPASKGYWNCIGNPYTSAIGINDGSGNGNNFLLENTDNLDLSYGAIYVWDKVDEFNGTKSYNVYSNAVIPYDFQQGQAFMIKMKSSANQVIFKPEMQIHNPALELKSTKGVWPTIKLAASFNTQNSSTIIAFHTGMTKGLDPTYDAGLLKGGSDLAVYSRLVEDNGIPFAIQALPLNDLIGTIIPVGLDFKTGGEVIFSAELLNLPSDCQVILEDKLSKTFTNLSESTYKTDLSANSSVSDRFQLHVSSMTTGVNIETNNDPLSAYAISKNEILIKGQVSKLAIATLYDIQGRVILVNNLKEGSLNAIRTPNIRTGIYMLSIKDNQEVKAFKIPIRE